MDFLEKLNSLMNDRGLNRNTLSAGSGIPYTTIDSFYKKGFENAKLSTIQKLADFFDTTLDYLMRDEIDDPNFGKASGFMFSFKEYERAFFATFCRKLLCHNKLPKPVVPSTYLAFHHNERKFTDMDKNQSVLKKTSSKLRQNFVKTSSKLRQGPAVTVAVKGGEARRLISTKAEGNGVSFG